MKRISQIDRLKSNNGDNIEVDNKFEYSSSRDLSEFSANEIPPLNVIIQAIDESIPPNTPVEKVDFTSLTGSYSIDFSINDRDITFLYPDITAYIVDSGTETKVQGMSEIINRSAGVIQSVDLDGLFGTGYILIKQ